MQQQTLLHGQSISTFNNYIRRIESISLHFGRLPQNITDEEINEYMAAMASDAKSPSRSSFKHAVYGLRYYYRHVGRNQRAIDLPLIKDDFKLPVILNHSELRELFKTPAYLKHRILLTLIYPAGLRSHEAIHLKIADIDFERQSIHIRQSKYRKDRIVPL
jgi:integrase/recombinase XerD